MQVSQSPARTRRKWFLGALLVPLALLLAACSGAPADLQTRSDAAHQRFETTKETIAANKKEFNSLLKDERYVFIAEYTDEQQHKDRFKQASSKLKEAETVYTEKVDPLLGMSYEESKRSALETSLAEVETLLAEADALAADPKAWLDRVAQTREQTSTLVGNARDVSNAIVADLALLENDAAASSQSFPAQATTIATKVAPLTTTRDSALATLSAVDTEVAKPKPNFAVVATGLMDIEGLNTSYDEASKKLRSDLGDLTVAETHTVLDFRVDSFLDVSRTSWDENSDAFTDHDYEYDLGLTDQEAASYFADKIGQVVATDAYWGGFGLASGIDQKMWDKLKIDPAENWPGGHNTAEYYIDGIEDNYCQKVKVLRDGEPDSSGRPDPAANYCSQYDTPSDLAKGIYWEEVDEFNAEAIGMDIYSKAYGDFTEQATTSATPPGMAYVGDPSTGEWREDSNGNSFWYYYGVYSFYSNLIGGPYPYHYRSEYDTWNRSYRYDNKPYYATTNGTARYGANSPQVGTRFPNSAFVKSGLDTATVRNAGPAARTDGPGNGGK